MDNLPTNQQRLEILTAEIQALKRQTAQNLIEIGRRVLGTDATLRQIANFVGPMFGLTGQQALEFLMYAPGAGDSGEHAGPDSG